MTTYNCVKCNAEYNSKKELLVSFKCKNCGRVNYPSRDINNLEDNNTNIENPITPNVSDGLLEGINGLDEISKDVDIKVESVKVDFQNQNTNPLINSSNLSSIQNNSTVNSRQSSRTSVSPTNKTWKSEPITKIFRQIDNVLVKKGGTKGKEIWNITPEEERGLGESWADVMNEWLPNASSKEAKLVNAIAVTLVTYVPRGIEHAVEYYDQKKAGKLPEKKEEKKQNEKQAEFTEVKNEPIIPPSNDQDFAKSWTEKKG